MSQLSALDYILISVKRICLFVSFKLQDQISLLATAVSGLLHSVSCIVWVDLLVWCNPSLLLSFLLPSQPALLMPCPLLCCACQMTYLLISFNEKEIRTNAMQCQRDEMRIWGGLTSRENCIKRAGFPKDKNTLKHEHWQKERVRNLVAFAYM